VCMLPLGNPTEILMFGTMYGPQVIRRAC
jgi:hypothetical protein